MNATQLEPAGSHDTNPFKHPVTGEPMSALDQHADDIAALQAENERLRKALQEARNKFSLLADAALAASLRFEYLCQEAEKLNRDRAALDGDE